MIEVTGAYGKTYKDFASAKKDWDDGKDFKIHPYVAYISKRNHNPMDTVIIFINGKLKFLATGWS